MKQYKLPVGKEIRYYLSHRKRMRRPVSCKLEIGKTMTQEIKLSNGNTTIVDDSDYLELRKYHWSRMKIGKYQYVARKLSDGNHVVLMHRQIMGFPPDYVDHIDGNGFNNTRLNLRPATNSLNQFNRHSQSNNTSGYRGVYLHKLSGKWEARLRLDRKNYYLGLYDSPKDASVAYELKRKELVGII
jgi:hypothetical protein